MVMVGMIGWLASRAELAIADTPSAGETTWDDLSLLIGLVFLVAGGAAAWLTRHTRKSDRPHRRKRGP
jgi:hypothetical protein